MTAVLLPLMLLFCAIVIDVGYWWVNGKKAQVAADACALAAAQQLPQTLEPRPGCSLRLRFGGQDYVLVNLPAEDDRTSGAPMHLEHPSPSP